MSWPGTDPMSAMFVAGRAATSEGPPCRPTASPTRVAAFLISPMAHWRGSFACALPLKLESAWQTELNAPFYYSRNRARFPATALRATLVGPDVAFGLHGRILGTAWFPRPIEGIPRSARWRWRSVSQRLHMPAHGRHPWPAALLPGGRHPTDHLLGWTLLRRIEFESSRSYRPNPRS